MYLITFMYRQVILGLVIDTILSNDDDDIKNEIKEEPKDQSRIKSLAFLEEDDLDYQDWLMRGKDFLEYHVHPYLGLSYDDDDNNYPK